MMLQVPKSMYGFRRFFQEEHGSASLEFVIVFPVFLGMLLMTYESGMISLRHVMLERAVDVAVRDVRIGAMPVPTRDLLRTRLCDVAMIIDDCENQVQIELIRRDPRAWVNVPSTVQCIDRGTADQPVVEFTNGGNNELMVMRVCARIDPFLPTSGLGKAIVESNAGDAAGGSHAMVTTAAFVVEPFQKDDED